MMIDTFMRSKDELAALAAQADMTKLFYDTAGYGILFCWSISFYPQLIQNWQRKSTAGMSVGSVWYNFLGFTLYLVYAIVTGQHMIQCQIFAGHAVLITALTLMQVPLYATNTLGEFPQLRGKPAGFALIVMDLCLALSVGKVMTIMDLMYACGSLKIAISLARYAPQFHLNWQRKSTDGFAMGAIFCDFAGCVCVFLQLLASCEYEASTGSLRSAWSWEPMNENKARIFLGVTAIFCNFAFVYQRFVMYPGAIPKEDSPTNSIYKSSASKPSYEATEAAMWGSPPAKPKPCSESNSESSLLGSAKSFAAAHPKAELHHSFDEVACGDHNDLHFFSPTIPAESVEQTPCSEREDSIEYEF